MKFFIIFLSCTILAGCTPYTKIQQLENRLKILETNLKTDEEKIKTNEEKIKKLAKARKQHLKNLLKFLDILQAEFGKYESKKRTKKTNSQTFRTSLEFEF